MSIRSEIQDGIARIEIARPERKNALTVQMYRMMAEALEAAAADPTVRALLLHGAPDVFSAGNDVQDFLAAQGEGLGAAPRFMQALAEAERPVVVAVTGPAVGIGTTLLMHCDLVYAADNAMFSMPFVPLGICPEFASSLLVPLAAGYHRAAEKLLLGEPISAEEALEMGLVNRLLPAGEVLDYAWRQARRLGALPPEAVRQTKRLLKAAWRSQVQQAMSTELETFGRLLQSPEAHEAMSAFLERRKPDFARAAARAREGA